MKIVLDTNVILAAFITEGLAHRVFLFCLNFQKIFISEWILREVEEKLNKKIKLPEKEIKEILQFLKTSAIVLKTQEPQELGCRDKDDNNILQLTLESKADIIITGDKDLQILKKFKKCQILTPRQFLERYIS